jgi:hypothetical protein
LPNSTNPYYNIYNYFGENEDNCNSKAIINRYEIKLLKCIKVRSRTEKNISKQIGLNTSIVYELINGLLIKGYIEKNRKRRLLFWHKELFSATIEGVVALEMAKVNNNNNETTLNRIISRIYGFRSNHQDI